MRIIAVLFLAIFMSTAAFASEEIEMKNWHFIETIKAFGNRIEIQMAPPHECGQAPNHYRLFSDAVNFDILSALMMSGYMSLSKVRLNYTCKGRSARITAIRLGRK